MDLLDLSAMDIARRIRSGDADPLEVVDAHIARIEEVNPALNAVVATRFDAAREEAVAVRERVHSGGDLPPLLGVPCTVKEFYAVQGLPNTGGIVRRSDHVAEADAVCVQRLRKAGAIVLGITNAPEGGLWSETSNRLYGRTHNPWDQRRTPGGSSGGSGAIVAAGGAAFGLGSDVGGSIRLPSAFCGTVGHKPTGWSVPRTGHFPEMVGRGSRMIGFGPLTRRVADVLPILRTLVGPDGADPNVTDVTLGDPDEVDVSGLRVFVVDAPRPQLAPAVHDAVERAARALGRRGARIERWSSGKLTRIFEMWAAILETQTEGSSYRDLLGMGSPVGLRWELLKHPFGRSRHITVSLALMMIEAAMKWVPASRKHGAASLADELQAELEALLGDDGVMLHAPYPTSAPRHHVMKLRPFDFVPCALFNVVAFPVTQVPTGFDDDLLPLGVQVAAARGRDHLTLATATALEQVFGGWVRAEPRAA